MKDIEELRKQWLKEEEIAHIVGWDFSHIHGRYEEEDDLPWDYEKTVRSYLRDDLKLFDYDTGGGEFLLSLNHPYDNTYCSEGYKPNYELCKERLIPLGIHLKECADPSAIPFENNSFDLFINRHGDFNVKEIRRVLKDKGIFITEQVGGGNDRDLVEMVLPEMDVPFPDLYLDKQVKIFEDNGFRLIDKQEAFRPIRFYDVGAFVWFAHIIEWEFEGFSVDRCFDKLIKMEEIIEEKGVLEGTIHRFLIVAKNEKN